MGGHSSSETKTFLVNYVKSLASLSSAENGAANGAPNNAVDIQNLTKEKPPHHCLVYIIAGENTQTSLAESYGLEDHFIDLDATYTVIPVNKENYDTLNSQNIFSNNINANWGYVDYSDLVPSQWKEYVTTYIKNKEWWLKQIEAFVATLPEAGSASFLLLRETKRLESLLLAFVFEPEMYALEKLWMGSAIEESAHPVINPMATSQPAHHIRKQLLLTLAPIVYGISVVQAGVAIGINPLGIAALALVQYTLQLMKACYAYNEWAKVNNQPPLKEALFLSIPMQVLSTLGITNFAIKTWTAMEWYIHFAAFIKFTDVLTALKDQTNFPSQSVINHYKMWIANIGSALFLGSCQTPFTSFFDISRFEKLRFYVERELPQYTKVEGKLKYPARTLAVIQEFNNTFISEFFGHPVLRDLISGVYLNKLKTLVTGKSLAFYWDLIMKVIAGFAIGGVGGLAAHDELMNADHNMPSKDLLIGLVATFAVGYALVNFLQGYYGKYEDTWVGIHLEFPNSLLNKLYKQCNESRKRKNSHHDKEAEQSVTASEQSVNSKQLLVSNSTILAEPPLFTLSNLLKTTAMEAVGAAETVLAGLAIFGTVDGLINYGLDEAGQEDHSIGKQIAMGAVITQGLALTTWAFGKTVKKMYDNHFSKSSKYDPVPSQSPTSSTS